MALSINNYIDIKSKIIQATVGNRDFSGLVFSKDGMKAFNGSGTDPNQGTRADYAAGKSVALTREGVEELFEDSSDIAKFADKYFGYNGGNHSPSVLNVAAVLKTDGGSTYETAKSAYSRVVGGFKNFGSLTFVGDFTMGASGDGGILDVASANDSNDTLLIVAVSSSAAASAGTSLSGIKNVHVVVSTPASGTTNLAAWMCMAWYASVDYTKTDASSSIDYKQFGDAYEVTDDDVKATYDAAHENYVGLVQVNGSELKFYQPGVNVNGVDTGVVRDSVWMEGEIEAGWFNLNSEASKIPANAMGCAMVKAMVVDVAARGVSNGSILLDKELTNAQISRIRAYTDNETAPDIIQSAGYYVDAKIIPEGDKYTCVYTLVYAKGDHIGKVSGTNYLV